MIHCDSLESEELRKLIDNKKKFLSKQTNKTAAQFLQKEILFLERDVLPTVQVGTELLYHECAKYFVRALNLSMKFDCNGTLVYIPLKEEYVDRPKVGIFNCKDSERDAPGAVWIEVINMDSSGVAVEPINIPLGKLI